MKGGEVIRARKLIANARKSRRMSLTSLGKVAGLSPSAISRFERGIGQTQDQTIKKLLSALGLEGQFNHETDSGWIDVS